MSFDDFSILRANSINSNDSKVHKPTLNGSSLSPAAASSSTSALNSRSCVTCRRRKVKCDKKHPCSNCIRQGIECVFPAPGRAPRKPKKPLDGELADRLRRLESLVQSLGPQVTSEGSDEPNTPMDSTNTETDDPSKKEESHDEKFARVKKEFKEIMREKHAREEKEQPLDAKALSSRFGNLVVHEGRSRNISPGLWATLKTELQDIKSDQDLLDSEDDEDDYPSPSTSANSNLPSFIFSNSSSNVDMMLLHPAPEHIPEIWDIYKDRVDPLLKTLHTPTREPEILNAATHLDTLSKPMECVMFSTYFAAITSLKPDECKYKFGESKSDLLARFRFGMEQSLARADFLKTDSVFVLHAFLIYLVCLRPNENPRVVWSLTSLAVRMAQGIGLHRDGDHFPNLTPYKKEMRRRLWWHAAILDLRASEDLGSDPSVYDMMADTKLPRNLNDEDISFGMEELPESRVGVTDMTFSLIRFEISRLLRHMSFSPPGDKNCPKFRGRMFSFEQRKEKLETLENRIETQYLKNIDYSNPVHWLNATSARLILSKMRLLLYVPYQRRDGGASLPKDVRDELFKAATDNVEIAVSYQSQGRAIKYSWLLTTYTQWHAIAFLLRELCVRTLGDDVERAWSVVELAMSSQSEEINKLSGHLWKPLRALRDKAKQQRADALATEKTAKEQSNFFTSSTGDLPTSLPGPLAPQPGFHQENDFAPSNNPAMMNLDFGVDRLYPLQTNQANGSELNSASILQSPNPFWPQAFTSPQSMDGLSMSMAVNDAATINFQPSPTTNNMSNQDVSWMNTSLDINSTAPIINDDTMNWATFDDMVQQYALQNEMHIDGPNTVPGFYGTGSSLF